MRTSVILLAMSLALIVGAIVYSSRHNEPVASTSVAEETRDQAVETTSERVILEDDPSRNALQTEAEPVRPVPAVSAPVEAPSDDAASPAAVSTPFSRAIDALVSSQTSFEQKQAAWNQLRDSGQLDQAIEALKRGAAENPASAAYPAALGQAQLQKAGAVARAGGKVSEMGILGMQADQNFDAALELDPENWEAQFFKAAAMSYWPPELKKGEEVIQRLSRLVDQQERSPTEPQFAQTYVLLGDQYQKMGNSDYAAATWRLGAKMFPGNPALQQKIREQ